MSHHDFSNRTLDGRYALVRRIGVGGMATVYEAVDRQIDKRVAVKVLHPEYAADASLMARFRQEARSAAKIQHAHLVDVTDQGQSSDGLAYFVMEYLEGESLGDYIHRVPGPMPWRMVVAIAVQVCEALEVAHERGIVHRDIKPANCFLETRRGTGQVVFVKVLDLGIAKVRQDEQDPLAPPHTRESQGVPGTPEYMAPELARGLPFDRRVDIYALGIMMYRLLTGELPFFSPTAAYETLVMHCNEEPRPLRQLNPAVPERLEQIVLTALRKSPFERYATAGQMAAELQQMFETAAAQQSVAVQQPVLAEESRTSSFYRPPVATMARRLVFASTVLGGFTTAATMFMVMMLFEGPGQTAPPSSAEPSTTPGHAPHVVVEPAAPAAPPPSALPAPSASPPPLPASEPASPTPQPVADVAVEAPRDPPEVQDGPSATPLDREPREPVHPKPGAGSHDPDTTMVTRTMARGKRAVAAACSGKVSMFDGQVTIDAEVFFKPRGTPFKVAAKPPGLGTNLGKCVEAELMRLPFKAIVGDTEHFPVSVTIKAK